jgi:hypothetical protein
LLISNRHKFIFVHVPKTAGTSLARALEPYSDNHPREGLRRILSHLPVPESHETVAFRMHVTARWARLKLPADVYNGYRKFAVVRNPYDRAVSLYHYLSQRTDHHLYERVSRMSFKGYLDYLAKRRRSKDPTQLFYIGDAQGQPIVDDILRFENLNDDFANLCGNLGMPGRVELPMRNTSDHSPYWEYYTDDRTRDMVRDLFAVDFAAFGYSTNINERAVADRKKMVA